MSFGAADLAHDIRLACHGLDTNDNDFVVGLIGKDLYPAVGRRAVDAQDAADRALPRPPRPVLRRPRRLAKRRRREAGQGARRLRAARRVGGAVHHDLGPFERHEAFAHHAIERWEKGLDLLRRIDDFDDHREVRSRKSRSRRRESPVGWWSVPDGRRQPLLRGRQPALARLRVRFRRECMAAGRRRRTAAAAATARRDLCTVVGQRASDREVVPLLRWPVRAGVRRGPRAARGRSLLRARLRSGAGGCLSPPRVAHPGSLRLLVVLTDEARAGRPTRGPAFASHRLAPPPGLARISSCRPCCARTAGSPSSAGGTCSTSRSGRHSGTAPSTRSWRFGPRSCAGSCGSWRKSREARPGKARRLDWRHREALD